MFEPADAVAKILNRLCFCVFLFVFNALLFYWVDTVHTTVNASFAKEAFKGTLDYEYMTKGGRIFFWGSTVLVILLTVCKRSLAAGLCANALPHVLVSVWACVCMDR